MNKKYLILTRKKPIKAYLGNNTLPIDSMTSGRGVNGMLRSPYANEGVDASTSLRPIGNNLNNSPVTGSKMSSLTSGITSFAGTLSDNYFAGQSAKNNRQDSFGNEVFDEKDAEIAKKQGTTSGVLKGAGTGASIGSVLGPWGTAAGAVIGGVVGGIFGNKKAKEQAGAQKKAYDVSVINNTSSATREADARASRAIMGKNGTTLGEFKLLKKKDSALKMRTGGKLEKPGEVNVVVKGKLHRENNNLGNKDKGMPVVNTHGEKEYEVEKEEIILRNEVTKLIEDYADRYDRTKDESVYEELGGILAEELLNNTQDNTGKFGVKVEENED